MQGMGLTLFWMLQAGECEGMQDLFKSQLVNSQGLECAGEEFFV